MGANSVPPGGRLLGHPQGVNIQQVTILPMAGVDFKPGWLPNQSADMHLEVVDVPHGHQMLVPFDIRFAERLHKRLGDLIVEHKIKEAEA